MKSRLSDIFEKRFVPILLLITICFVIYKILYNCFKTTNICGSHSLLDFALFGLLFVLIYLVYNTGKDLRKNKIIAIFIIIALSVQISGYVFWIDSEWKDGGEYADAAVVIYEKGLPYFLGNYHHFCGANLMREEDMIAINTTLDDINLSDWKKEIWDEEMCNIAPDRRLQHPPFWIILISLFYIPLGPSDFSALVATWIISIFVTVSFYFLLKEFIEDKRPILIMTVLFVLSPLFILMTHSPENFMIQSLLGILLTLFLIRSIKRSSMVYAMLSGLGLSLGIITNFSFLTMFLPVLMILLLSDINRKLKLNIFLIILLSSITFVLALVLYGYNPILNVITAKQAVTAHHRLHPDYFPWFLAPFEKIKFLFYISLPVTLLTIRKAYMIIKDRQLDKDLGTLIGTVFLFHCFLLMFVVLSQETTFRYLAAYLPMLFLISLSSFSGFLEKKHAPFFMILATFIQTLAMSLI